MTRKPGRILRAGVFAGLCLILGIAGFLFYKHPRIDAVRPAVYEPGSIIGIEGRGFGWGREGSRVEIDGAPLIESAYISWSEHRISIAAPTSPGPSLVRIRSPWGRSDEAVIVAKSVLPEPYAEVGGAFPAPDLRSIEPEEARAGDLLILRGANFGTGPEFSSVLFTRNPSAPPRVFSPESSPESLDLFIEPDRSGDQGLSGYESWDDKEIRVRVPDHAGSGSIRVRTPLGESAPLEFKLKPIQGKKYYFDPKTYAIEFFLDLEARRLESGGSILAYLLEPASTSSQSLISVQYAQDGGPARLWASNGVLGLEAEGSGGPASARFTISSSLLVYGVETDLSGYSEVFDISKTPAFLQPFLGEDPLIPASNAELKSIAARIRGAQKNPQARASSARDWLLKNMSWEEKAQRSQPSAALKARRADTASYVFISCALLRAAQVPAVPISGFLVGDSGELIPHLWLEYYLPGVGWIPFDPVLARGGKPKGFTGGLESESRYFGNLDNRHIAHSWGFKRIRPRFTGGIRRSSGPLWSLQDVFEESTKASYSSVWRAPVLAGESQGR